LNAFSQRHKLEPSLDSCGTADESVTAMAWSSR
jgi:hypothetical protein